MKHKKMYNLNIITLLLFSCIFSSYAFAHFKLNLNVRIFHVEHQADGLNIYMRLPMPYLVAHLLRETDANGLSKPVPYTNNRLEQGKLLHSVDVEQLRNSTDGLALLAMQGLNLAIEGKNALTTVEALRIYKNGTQPDFATLADAKQVFQQKTVFDAFEQEVFVGDTTVDVLLRYSNEALVYNYALSSSLNPGLPDQDETANLILDYSPSGTQVFRERGLLQDPIIVSRSVFDAVITFVKEGAIHILEGIDHVLFVICLVLGAMYIKPLLWRVTGFTVGHSITLSLGFMGFVPTAAWFVPAIETGIALSIIYVAVVALLPLFKPDWKPEKSEWTVVGITVLIGLLHGLGFSFVLQNILQVTSPNIWQSLLAFNLGVELGQLFIVLLTVLIFYIISRLGDLFAKVNRALVAGACIAISLYWVVERGSDILVNI